jgi:DMSO/TMAO reductase YedYZ molybdopterin-dependent catalytic subunit
MSNRLISTLIRGPFIAGFVAGLVAGLGMLGLRPFVNAPSPQELITERLLLFISARLFETLLEQVWTLGKVLAVVGTTFLLAFGCGFLGAVIQPIYRLFTPGLRSHPAVRGMTAASIFWLVAGLVLLPLLDIGLFGRRVIGDYTALQGMLLAGSAAYGVVFTWIRKEGSAPASTSVPVPRGVARRELLQGGLAWAVMLLSVGSGLRFIFTAGAHGIRGLAALREDPGQMPSEITPVNEFYRVTKNLIDPDLSESSWHLSVEGSVGQPFRLTLGDLRALSSVEQIVTLECIENEVGGRLISNALWRGVRLRDLLERAEVQSNAARIVFRAADGYDESLSLAEAMQPEVMVAYEMNGLPLTKDHGFPARLLVPGRYGVKSAKWLQSISAVQDASYSSYWQKRGWDLDAIVKMTSQIIVPRALDPVVLGEQTFAGGIAFGGAGGIMRVEFSADAGNTWREATLSPAMSAYSWVLWTTDFVLTDRRQRTLKVRAYDGAGTPQIEVDSDSAPAGATGLHTRILFSIKDASAT